ncbi:MAG: hypothetical protein K2H46_03955 [Muribaculaceae bacterium]|nr:hypothetical protein [Muribaculaceae bacterium]
MKAKVLATDEIVEVVDYNDSKVTVYRNDETEFFAQNEYSRDEVEFLSDTPEKVIEGWVAVDEWGIGGCFLHTQKPHAESREFCDTGDYEIGWESDGEKYELDSKLFLDMDCESEPKRVKLTITPME